MVEARIPLLVAAAIAVWAAMIEVNFGPGILPSILIATLASGLIIYIIWRLEG